MKIIHEVNQLAYGGMERIVHDIIKFDKVNDHAVLTYKDGPFRKEFEALNVPINVLNEETTMQLPADLLHIHTGGSNSQAAEDLAGEIPIVETIHSPVRSMVSDKHVTRRIGVSDAVTRMNKNCSTILNGIDFERFAQENNYEELRAKYNIKPEQIVVGRCGRVARDKNVTDWLLACFYLQAQGYDVVPFVIGGETEPGYLGRMKLVAECLPVKNVIWAGHQNNPGELLDVMDIFLYPSETEGFGLTFIEAMFRGIPVVTYKTDVTIDVLGGYSILTDVKDGIQGLVRGVQTCMIQGVIDEMVPLAKDYVISEFQAERMAQDYQQLYESLL